MAGRGRLSGLAVPGPATGPVPDPDPDPDGHWVTVWAASAQAAYPVGSPIAQPPLDAALPDTTRGLADQSLRMLLRPGLWSSRVRLRLSHVFGDRPLVLRDLGVALHLGGGALVPGSRVGLPDQVVAAGQSTWTPPVVLPWLRSADATLMQGRALAVSARVDGASGPVTWHAKSMATSYLSAPGDRDAAGRDDAFGFPHGTTSTFVVDAFDAWLPRSASAFVAFGDSLTDGTGTTLNGHDRWTDVLQREAWRSGRGDLAIVNAGIGGNQVIGPPPGSGSWRGGPCAVARVARDVLGLSGVRTVFWLQGINDFSDNGGAEAVAVAEAVAATVGRLLGQGLRVIGATLPSALGATRPGHGGALQDARRRAFNEVVRRGGLFDEFVDLDRCLSDARTGRLHTDFDGDDTLGGPGDGIHPNRAGHAAMARCIGATCLAPAAPGDPRGP